MGVSFKEAKVGTKYRPKPVQDEAKEESGGSVAESQPQSSHNEVHFQPVLCVHAPGPGSVT